MLHPPLACVWLKSALVQASPEALNSITCLDFFSILHFFKGLEKLTAVKCLLLSWVWLSEWGAIPFSRRSFQPRDYTRSSTLQADSLLCELPGQLKIVKGPTYIIKDAVFFKEKNLYQAIFRVYLNKPYGIQKLSIRNYRKLHI